MIIFVVLFCLLLIINIIVFHNVYYIVAILLAGGIWQTIEYFTNLKNKYVRISLILALLALSFVAFSSWPTLSRVFAGENPGLHQLGPMIAGIAAIPVYLGSVLYLVFSKTWK